MKHYLVVEIRNSDPETCAGDLKFLRENLHAVAALYGIAVSDTYVRGDRADVESVAELEDLQRFLARFRLLKRKGDSSN